MRTIIIKHVDGKTDVKSKVLLNLIFSVKSWTVRSFFLYLDTLINTKGYEKITKQN